MSLSFKKFIFWKPFAKLGAAAFGLAITLCMAHSGASFAAEGPRLLHLKNVHSGETASILYKNRGVFLTAGMKKINHIFRDWRRNEPTTMDPRVVDLLWEVYQEVRGKKPIHIISGYRSPATNNMLRAAGRGVAKRSQHTLGKAIDFYIPGVKLSILRAAALRRQFGGVGYYPTSGSPFIHIDVGDVRHWPRIGDGQLRRIFPKGGSLHVPKSGKPLPNSKDIRNRYGRKGFKPSLQHVKYAGGDYEQQLVALADKDSVFGAGSLVTAYARTSEPTFEPVRPPLTLTSLPARRQNHESIATLAHIDHEKFTAFADLSEGNNQNTGAEIDYLRTLSERRGLPTAIDSSSRPVASVRLTARGNTLADKVEAEKDLFDQDRFAFAANARQSGESIRAIAKPAGVNLMPTFDQIDSQSNISVIDTETDVGHDEEPSYSNDDLLAQVEVIQQRVQTAEDFELALLLSKNYLRRLN